MIPQWARENEYLYRAWLFGLNESAARKLVKAYLADWNASGGRAMFGDYLISVVRTGSCQ